MNQFNFNILALPVAKASPEVSAEPSADTGASAAPAGSETGTAGETHTVGETGTIAETRATGEEHSQGLSIQPTTLLAHGLNFVLLLVVLNLILYKPLTKLLSEREKKIREGVEHAEKAQVMLNEANMTKANILKQASVESQGMMEKARLAGENLKTEIVGAAHREAEHIVKTGQQAVEMERAKTLQELQLKAANLIVASAEKILRRKLDQKADADLIQESIKSYQV